ncbi:hypothetical protein [Photobacterium chitinilyticum]|uniref:hypothetical protein n=1 Tax=Photobacterium chitinilyticum TaxID=2485123 RepID=UPI0013E8EAF8|nr:hypothetical protein [Photobacterium chitinilyticum]
MKMLLLTSPSQSNPRVITKNNRAVKVQFKHKDLIQSVRGNNIILAAGEKAG